MNTLYPKLNSTNNTFTPNWSAELTTSNDWTLHQIAPYIGRMKTTMARSLIERYTKPGDLVADPFCGCGVIALEAASRRRNIYAGDWNPYAIILTRAKLHPPKNLEEAERKLKIVWKLSLKKLKYQDLRKTPRWVRKFFHPDTLRSALAFRDICMEQDEYFLMACLLGILHHQSIGFLSYPSSHLVPYLRDKKFPQEKFPEMYREREIYPRLLRKIHRTFIRFPESFSDDRKIFEIDARKFPLKKEINAVITSPPYINELDYIRDNRLRLWFLEKRIPMELELKNQNKVQEFTDLIQNVSLRLAPNIKKGGYFIIVVGNNSVDGKRVRNPSAITRTVFQKRKAASKF